MIEVEQDITFYSRWQFHPRAKPADLYGNGVADQADGLVLLTRGNQGVITVTLVVEDEIRSRTGGKGIVALSSNQDVVSLACQ